MRGSSGAAGALATAVVALVVAGCGGGERQDKSEPSGNFTVDVVKADFPPKQVLAKPERMTISVKNTDTRTIPDLAVTVESGEGDGGPGFGFRSKEAGLADSERPIWIVDTGPTGGTTAYTNTWALGAVKAGQTKTFTWRVTAIQPGKHVVKYRVAAGLNGKAHARLSGGREPAGSFTVSISGKPAQATVDPDTGKVIREGE